MTISSEITRLQGAKASIASAITEKGGTIPAGSTLDDYGEIISSLPSGGGEDDHGYGKVKYKTISSYGLTSSTSGGSATLNTTLLKSKFKAKGGSPAANPEFKFSYSGGAGWKVQQGEWYIFGGIVDTSTWNSFLEENGLSEKTNIEFEFFDNKYVYNDWETEKTIEIPKADLYTTTGIKTIDPSDGWGQLSLTRGNTVFKCSLDNGNYTLQQLASDWGVTVSMWGAETPCTVTIKTNNITYGNDTYEYTLKNADDFDSLSLTNATVKLPSGLAIARGQIVEYEFSPNWRGTSLPNNFLSEMPGLTKVSGIPSGLTAGERVFSGCKALRDIDVSGFVSVGGYFLHNASSLETVAFDNLESAGGSVLYGASNICGNITFPKLRTVGAGFMQRIRPEQNKSLHLYFPELTTVGEYAFSDQAKHNDFSMEFDKLSTVGKYFMSACANNGQVTFSSTLKGINDAFMQGMTSFVGPVIFEADDFTVSSYSTSSAAPLTADSTSSAAYTHGIDIIVQTQEIASLIGTKLPNTSGWKRKLNVSVAS